MSWQKIGNGERLVAGESYRMTLAVAAPYVAATTGAIRGAVYTKAALSSEFKVEKTDHAPPLAKSDGTMSPFPFWVYFHVTPAEVTQAGLDPRTLWSLAALVIGGLVALRVATIGIERLVVATGTQTREIIDQVGDTAKQTVLNPFVLVAALAGIYLFTRRH